MSSVVLGALITIIASVLSICGVNVQKYSHNVEEARDVPRPYHMRPIWWAGMLGLFAGAFGDFVALAFAPQTLVASLGGGLTILGNSIVSKVWLKQSLYITDILGLIMVTIGVGFLAGASRESGHYKVEHLYKLMTAIPFIIYCIVITIIISAILVRIRRSKVPAYRAIHELDKEIQSMTSSHISYPMTEHSRSEIDKESRGPRTCTSQSTVSSLSSTSPLSEEHGIGKDSNARVEQHLLVIDPKLPLYWAAVSGIVGAQSMLLAKCVAEIIAFSFKGENQFQHFGTYILIMMMTATILTQTHTLNLATMTGDTMSSYPVFQALWISISNINGIIFFQQAHLFSKAQYLFFPSALLMVLGGIYLISKHEKRTRNVRTSSAVRIDYMSSCQNTLLYPAILFRVTNPQQDVRI